MNLSAISENIFRINNNHFEKLQNVLHSQRQSNHTLYYIRVGDLFAPCYQFIFSMSIYVTTCNTGHILNYVKCQIIRFSIHGSGRLHISREERVAATQFFRKKYQIGSLKVVPITIGPIITYSIWRIAIRDFYLFSIHGSGFSLRAGQCDS